MRGRRETNGGERVSAPRYSAARAETALTCGALAALLLGACAHSPGPRSSAPTAASSRVPGFRGPATPPLPASCGRPAPGGGTALRVLTYNIAAGRFGLAGVVAASRAASPDLVGLEEVDVHFGARSGWVDQAAALADSLGMGVFFAPIYDLPPPAAGSPRRRFGLAILARCRIRAAVNHPLTRLSTQTLHPVPAPAPGFPEVTVDVGGRGVRFLATHLDYRRDPAVRRTQVAEMLRVLRRSGGPLILVGDLNATPDAAELHPLLATLGDAWSAAAAAGRASAPGASPPGFTYPAEAPRERIDYVLVRGPFEVDSAAVPDTEASDHRPVVVELRLR